MNVRSSELSTNMGTGRGSSPHDLERLGDIIARVAAYERQTRRTRPMAAKPETMATLCPKCGGG